MGRGRTIGMLSPVNRGISLILPRAGLRARRSPRAGPGPCYQVSRDDAGTVRAPIGGDDNQLSRSLPSGRGRRLIEFSPRRATARRGAPGAVPSHAPAPPTRPAHSRETLRLRRASCRSRPSLTSALTSSSRNRTASRRKPQRHNTIRLGSNFQIDRGRPLPCSGGLGNVKNQRY